MKGEQTYGNDDPSRHDVVTWGQLPFSADGIQAVVTITKLEEKPLDINNSNGRLDKYLFYFSSRL
jgi:hypothetical protein